MCHYGFFFLLYYRKTIETEEKSETPSQSVSQSSTSASTSVPAESTSAGTSKEAESKDSGSGEAIDNPNNSSNELTVKAAKDTDNLKRPIVEEEEEVKPKKRKEEHSQSSKGNLSIYNLILKLIIMVNTINLNI